MHSLPKRGPRLNPTSGSGSTMTTARQARHPVCALLLDRLRASLTAHGWNERTVPSEIGSILAIEFAKRELVLTLTPRDVEVIDDAKCVMALQVSGGH